MSASRQISEMIGKLQRLDEQYREVRRREAEGSKDVVEWKEKYAESRKEVEQLRGERAEWALRGRNHAGCVARDDLFELRRQSRQRSTHTA